MYYNVCKQFCPIDFCLSHNKDVFLLKIDLESKVIDINISLLDKVGVIHPLIYPVFKYKCNTTHIYYNSL